MGLAKIGGADTEDDPRSPDFGKIKSGNTRWDIWGGHQQYIRALAQIISGKKKRASGEIVELGGSGPYDQSRGGVAGTFFRGKLAPVPSVGLDILMGENIVGDRLTTKWESGKDEVGIKENLKTHLLPLLYTGMEEAWKEQGPKSLLVTLVPSVFGVGVNTYSTPPASNVKKSKPSKPAKKDKK